ncbi:response regulator, partial [Pulveribacter sp.]|uniref:response regulator n=1 Tax=Pulveribacter sp. TaxID=2678893 RepID=UPI0028996F35
MRILYVEDNPELRETIAMLMEAPGRCIVSCASAEEALAHDGDQGPFDLVMTDVSLPGMSGPELCR